MGGCSGRLVVTGLDDKGVATALPGIPVRSYEMFVVEGQFTSAAKGGECTPTVFQKVASLPTGNVYYVRPEGSALAKTTFTLKVNGDGALTEVQFNSESNAPETIKAVNEVLKTLPALGVAGGKAPSPGDKPACDAGEKLTKLTPYAEWMNAH